MAEAEVTQTITETQSADQENPTTMVLTLKKPKSDKQITWKEGTVDNENMNKKKSKCCCIYEKPRLFDESSSEESEDDDPIHEHKHRKQKAKHEQGCPMHDHSHDHDGEGKQDGGAEKAAPAPDTAGTSSVPS